jgi:hypothetical protein
VFETPASHTPPARPDLVLTALLVGSLLLFGVALAVGPLEPGTPLAGALVGLGLGAALLTPALGALVGGRLRRAGTPETPAAEREPPAPDPAQALIVEGALCEAGALLCGVSVLVHGPDWRLLVAALVPLGRLLVLRNEAAGHAPRA